MTYEVIWSLWGRIYDDLDQQELLEAYKELNAFFERITALKAKVSLPSEQEWYKDAVVYAVYVDLFAGDFPGMTSKLDYLESLGVNCLWLLPILESPMKDAGFDIADYTAVRKDLLGVSEDQAVFEQFIEAAHRRGIHIIFDIAMNHCSQEHPWFVEARQSKASRYRDYFIWAENDQGYGHARIIFKGLCKSNWEKDSVSGQYYFHRFFEIQPDLNYRNPKVLLEMTKILVDWRIKGIDGFRADAVPYIWKEEGTICENHPKTHLVVKFF